MDVERWEKLATKDGYEPSGRRMTSDGEVFVAERLCPAKPDSPYPVEQSIHYEILYAIASRIGGTAGMDIAQNITLSAVRFPFSKQRVGMVTQIAQRFMDQGKKAGRYVQ